MYKLNQGNCFLANSLIEMFPLLILNIKVLYTLSNNCLLGDQMDASYRLKRFKDQASRLHAIYLTTIPFPKNKKGI